MLKHLHRYLNTGEDRTVEAKKNIFFSFFNKALSIVISLMLVTLTIKYINATQYGIWLTISSIVGWMTFFDFGFAHGFRNKFTEARAKGNMELARKYVSTTYAVLIIIFVMVLLISVTINSFISWSDVLKLKENMDEELTRVFFILIFFFCIQIVLNIITTLLLADQKAAFSSFVTTLGQLFVLLSIFILTKLTLGSLTYLAFAVSAIPCLIFFVISIYLFSNKYKSLTPRAKSVDFSLSRNIIGLGSKFFIIQISMLFVFQFANIILSRVLGPEAVTEYNIAYKYFSVIYMVCLIVFNPFWSAFTDAYTKHDFDWMKNVYSKLSKAWYITVPMLVVMLIVSPLVYRIWIGSSVNISFNLSLIMGIYILLLSRANLYMYLINGTGKVTLQLIVYVIFALVSIPLMIMFSKMWGVVGVVLVPILVYLAQCLAGHVQIKRILNNTAKGIWNK